jgi:hypothetical protein
MKAQTLNTVLFWSAVVIATVLVIIYSPVV